MGRESIVRHQLGCDLTVSVSSQYDTQRADIEKERRALDAAPEAELAELTQIYAERGFELELAALARCHRHRSGDELSDAGNQNTGRGRCGADDHARG